MEDKKVFITGNVVKGEKPVSVEKEEVEKEKPKEKEKSK